MNRLSIFAVVAMSGCVVFAQSQKVTVEGKQAENNPRKVALVVQNHAALGANIPIIALSDALTAKLSGRGLQVRHVR